MLKLLLKEQHFYPYIYDLSKIAKKIKTNMPNKESLQDFGFFLPFDENAFSSFLDLRELEEKLSGRGRI